MIEQAHDDGDRPNPVQERREFRSYVWGVCLALVLTLAAFAVVHWHVWSITHVLFLIGGLAVVQMAVHFRLFLHIGFKQKREDLQLILFSGLLLVIMIGGTVWIMSSLASRMTIPLHP